MDWTRGPDCGAIFIPRTRMREGVKQLVLSVSLFVSLSVCEKFLNLNI